MSITIITFGKLLKLLKLVEFVDYFSVELPAEPYGSSYGSVKVRRFVTACIILIRILFEYYYKFEFRWYYIIAYITISNNVISYMCHSCDSSSYFLDLFCFYFNEKIDQAIQPLLKFEYFLKLSWPTDNKHRK